MRPMAAPVHTDAVRKRAIDLYLEGYGYKAVARELGLSRDVVRNWIAVYKKTGRKEALRHTQSEPVEAGKELEKRLARQRERIAENEEKYRQARRAYENGEESLMKVAEQHEVSYASLREFINRYHPESRLLHTYAKERKQVQDAVAEQVARVQKMGEDAIVRMSENLAREMAKLKKNAI